MLKNPFEEALENEINKNSGDIVEKLLKNEIEGHEFKGRLPKETYGPIINGELQEKIYVSTNDICEKLWSKNNKRMSNFVERDAFIMKKAIPTTIIKSMETMLDVNEEEAIEFFMKGPRGSIYRSC